MYQPMLWLHWRQVRLGLIPLVVAAFALPLVSVQGLGGAGSATEIYQALEVTSLWLPAFPILSVAVGLTLAVTAWSWDHKLNHVYALSLPVARWRYALLKMGSGALLALLPVAAFWVGAHVATLSLAIPEALTAYPDELALRFGLAVLLSYAAVFALAAGTFRTAVTVLGGLTLALFAAGLLDPLLADRVPYFQEVGLAERLLVWLGDGHGPLRVFNGNWSLIDV